MGGERIRLKDLSLDEIRKRARKLREKIDSQKQPHPESEKDKFCRENAIAPVIATICDQDVNADHAFGFPLWLSRQLGKELSAELIVDVGEREIRQLLKKYMRGKWPSGIEKERKEQYLRNVPRWIVKTCRKIVEQFDGDPDNMFKEGAYTSSELYFILTRLDGIGQKKASMVVRDFIKGTTPWVIGLRERLKEKGIDFRVEEPEHSSVPVDIDVTRVFCRIMGEKARALREDILRYYPDIQYFAKMTYPEFPAKVDDLLWEVGRNYCKGYPPKCEECPLRDLPCEYAKSSSTQ